MQTNVRLYPTFDNAEFEDALKAADFDRCHEIIDGSETLVGDSTVVGDRTYEKILAKAALDVPKQVGQAAR